MFKKLTSAGGGLVRGSWSGLSASVSGALLVWSTSVWSLELLPPAQPPYWASTVDCLWCMWSQLPVSHAGITGSVGSASAECDISWDVPTVS